MFNLLTEFLFDEKGQAMTEYGLILALIAVLLIGTLLLLKDELVTMFEKVVTGLQGQAPTP
ncbi:Flp family type IVb pilin [Metallumcola ferriviriculae]|uniref:Flp family type IVb pilin n=1 Tax=Metallumcola ferriviriculae TaxID=3039180 RepID=A0AAU0USW0_9FIRM|nr:Flp family type IVb pilin [Desulfitibacteraceae bacterium MK1]